LFNGLQVGSIGFFSSWRSVFIKILKLILKIVLGNSFAKNPKVTISRVFEQNLSSFAVLILSVERGSFLLFSKWKKNQNKFML